MEREVWLCVQGEATTYVGIYSPASSTTGNCGEVVFVFFCCISEYRNCMHGG
jgi:hypothetical protein